MKFNINITTVVLLGLIILFAWLWLSKSPEVIQDTTKEKELLELIKQKDLELEKSTIIIDSINKLVISSIEEVKKANYRIKVLNKKYNEEITTINNQFINADIELFRTNFLSDSINNQR